MRRRVGRKRATGTRAPMTLPQGANQRWSLDFVTDALACGRRFRILAVVDDVSRECLALVADTSLSGGRVARGLDAIVQGCGRPLMIVSDRRGQASSPRDCWPEEGHRADEHGGPEVGAGPAGRVAHHRARAEPQQNGHVESFNGRLRDERVNVAGAIAPEGCSRRWLTPARCSRAGNEIATTCGRMVGQEG